MKGFQKFLVWFLKFLGYFVMCGLTALIVINKFYYKQNNVFRLGISGILILFAIMMYALHQIKKYRKVKEVAYEVARNLGKHSQTASPITLKLLEYASYMIPFIVLMLFEMIAVTYVGSIYFSLILFMGAFTLGYGIIILAVLLEQSFLKKAELAEVNKQQNELLDKLEERLKKK